MGAAAVAQPGAAYARRWATAGAYVRRWATAGAYVRRWATAGAYVRRWATTSAMMLSAISSGVSAPTSMPMGA